MEHLQRARLIHTDRLLPATPTAVFTLNCGYLRSYASSHALIAPYFIRHGEATLSLSRVLASPLPNPRLYLLGTSSIRCYSTGIHLASFIFPVCNGHYLCRTNFPDRYLIVPKANLINSTFELRNYSFSSFLALNLLSRLFIWQVVILRKVDIFSLTQCYAGDGDASSTCSQTIFFVS